MTDCLFCKFVSGEIPPNIVYQDEDVLGFRDLHPQAPVHCLVIPKQHFSTINEATDAQTVLMGKLVLAAQKIAKQEGVDETGYRLVMNCNADGGQSVYHIHLHLLAGRSLHWPPG